VGQGIVAKVNNFRSSGNTRKSSNFDDEIFIEPIIRLIHVAMGVANDLCAPNLILYGGMDMSMNPELRLVFENHSFKIGSICG
jgi:hypothetical protein